MQSVCLSVTWRAEDRKQQPAEEESNNPWMERFVFVSRLTVAFGPSDSLSAQEFRQSVKIVKKRKHPFLNWRVFFHLIALSLTSSVKNLNFGVHVFSLFQTSRDHVTSLDQTMVPQHHYFSAQFLLQFSTQSIYHVTVCSSVIDSSGILWNTGPQNSLQIKTTDSANRKQRTSRS